MVFLHFVMEVFLDSGNCEVATERIYHSRNLDKVSFL